MVGIYISIDPLPNNHPESIKDSLVPSYCRSLFELTSFYSPRQQRKERQQQLVKVKREKQERRLLTMVPLRLV